jgi:integrase
VEADDFVVLPKPAIKAVRTWLKVRGKKKGSLFWSLSKQNKGERLSARALRGMVKQRYEEAGVQVQAMARHKSYDTTLNYYHELSRTENPAEDLIIY